DRPRYRGAREVVTPAPSPLAGVPEPGAVIAGKYVVERVLGVGGMGAVVAAHHQELGHRVALKFLLPGSLGDRDAIERFAREARAAATIQSDYVARVIDIGTLDNGAPYLVMEYLPGRDLAAVVERERDHRLPVETAVDVLIQAAVAL